jgi:hypothetical protein
MPLGEAYLAGVMFQRATLLRLLNGFLDQTDGNGLRLRSVRGNDRGSRLDFLQTC